MQSRRGASPTEGLLLPLQHSRREGIHWGHKGQSDSMEAVPESSHLRRECWPRQVSSGPSWPSL